MITNYQKYNNPYCHPDCPWDSEHSWLYCDYKYASTQAADANLLIARINDSLDKRLADLNSAIVTLAEQLYVLSQGNARGTNYVAPVTRATTNTQRIERRSL